MWLVNQAVLAKLDEFKAIAADKATTMGHIQRHHLDEPVVVPTKETTARLHDLMTGLWDEALSVEVETLKLAQTRDELMPLLMSGTVRVRDVEQQLVKVAI
jgi:type I restriction enzyme S subunit